MVSLYDIPALFSPTSLSEATQKQHVLFCTNATILKAAKSAYFWLIRAWHSLPCLHWTFHNNQQQRTCVLCWQAKEMLLRSSLVCVPLCKNSFLPHLPLKCACKLREFVRQTDADLPTTKGGSIMTALMPPFRAENGRFFVHPFSDERHHIRHQISGWISLLIALVSRARRHFIWDTIICMEALSTLFSSCKQLLAFSSVHGQRCVVRMPQ